nr:hypothetical protein CFP56_00712 [Quercus suber]
MGMLACTGVGDTGGTRRSGLFTFEDGLMEEGLLPHYDRTASPCPLDAETSDPRPTISNLNSHALYLASTMPLNLIPPPPVACAVETDSGNPRPMVA